MATTSTCSALFIEHTTLATSLGDDWITSVVAFAARRKQFRYKEIEGFKLLTAPANDLAGNTRGIQRLYKLLHAVWHPMAAYLHALPQVPTLYLLALPEWMARPSAGAASEQSGDSTPLHDIVSVFRDACRRDNLPVYGMEGFAGGAEASHRALAHGFRTLQHDLPPAQIVLLAADSLCDADVLLRDYRAGRIYGKENSSGWVPGEAAACLLLRPVANTAALSAGGALLYQPRISDAPTQPPRWLSHTEGDGRLLQQAITGALEAAGIQPRHIRRHLSDSDGSSWRLEDETAAIDRMAAIDDSATLSAAPLQPAELLGQVGAAWGAVQWALAAGLHRHGLAAIGRAICSTQDPQGHCSANAIECPDV